MTEEINATDGARELAEELGLDLVDVVEVVGGRVTKPDVAKFAEENSEPDPEEEPAPEPIIEPEPAKALYRWDNRHEQAPFRKAQRGEI